MLGCTVLDGGVCGESRKVAGSWSSIGRIEDAITPNQEDVDGSEEASDVLSAMKNPNDLQLFPLNSIENHMADDGQTANVRR